MDYNTLVNTMIANEIKRLFDLVKTTKPSTSETTNFIKLSSKVI